MLRSGLLARAKLNAKRNRAPILSPAAFRAANVCLLLVHVLAGHVAAAHRSRASSIACGMSDSIGHISASLLVSLEGRTAAMVCSAAAEPASDGAASDLVGSEPSSGGEEEIIIPEDDQEPPGGCAVKLFAMCCLIIYV